MIVIYKPTFVNSVPFNVDVRRAQWKGTVANAASVFSSVRERFYPSHCVWIVPGTAEDSYIE